MRSGEEGIGIDRSAVYWDRKIATFLGGVECSRVRPDATLPVEHETPTCYDPPHATNPPSPSHPVVTSQATQVALQYCLAACLSSRTLVTRRSEWPKYPKDS